MPVREADVQKLFADVDTEHRTDQRDDLPLQCGIQRQQAPETTGSCRESASGVALLFGWRFWSACRDGGAGTCYGAPGSRQTIFFTGATAAVRRIARALPSIFVREIRTARVGSGRWRAKTSGPRISTSVHLRDQTRASMQHHAMRPSHRPATVRGKTLRSGLIAGGPYWVVRSISKRLKKGTAWKDPGTCRCYGDLRPSVERLVMGHTDLTLLGVERARTIRSRHGITNGLVVQTEEPIGPRTGETKTGRQYLPMLRSPSKGPSGLAGRRLLHWRSAIVAVSSRECTRTPDGGRWIPKTPRDMASWLEWCFFCCRGLDCLTSLY